MIFIKIFGYIIFAYGISNIIVYGEGPWGCFETFRGIMNNISEGFCKLFNCMMCFSTWVGLLFSGIDLLIPQITLTPFNIIINNSHLWWLILIMDMGFTSGIVWLLHNFEEACERHGTIEFEDEERG